MQHYDILNDKFEKSKAKQSDFWPLLYIIIDTFGNPNATTNKKKKIFYKWCYW